MSIILIWTAAAIIAFVPVIVVFLIWCIRNGTPEQRQYITRSFWFGALGIVPLLAIQYMLRHTPHLSFLWEIFMQRWFFFATLILAVLLALLEEFIKYFAARTQTFHELVKEHSQLSVILCFVCAGLGFGCMENILYFKNIIALIGVPSGIWAIVVFRSFGTLLGHAIFSGIFGILWVRSSLPKLQTHSS